LGLHARAAAKFVHIAATFESRIRVGRVASAEASAPRDSKMMDGKSIMGILLLAAARGTTLTISADGPDEGPAIEALVRLVETGFGESTAGPGSVPALEN
jgi:phosphocarrier protein